MLELLIRWCGEKIENEAALPFHEAAAEKYGKICADLHRKGTPIGTKDMLITGHAKVKKCVCNAFRYLPCMPGSSVSHDLKAFLIFHKVYAAFFQFLIKFLVSGLCFPFPLTNRIPPPFAIPARQDGCC